MARARSRPGHERSVERAFSAGGVVLRDGSHGAEVVLGRRCHDRRRAIWSLPKGTPDGDETPAATAVREVAEETGLRVRIIDHLGDIHYRFVREGVRIDKTVRYYLMEPIGGDLAGHDHEFEEVRWFGVAEADAAMQFATERDIVARAVSASSALSASSAGSAIDLPVSSAV